jgi:DNA-binding NtrC family response regulator
MFLDKSVILGNHRPADRVVLETAFRRVGLRFAGEVRTTDDLLLRMDEHPHEVVVMDVTLPGTIDPLVTLREVSRRNRACVVFALGALSQRPLVMEALTMGAVDFFSRPLHLSTLRTVMERHLY